MSKDEEIAMLRALASQHMDEKNYYLASRYLSLIEDVDSNRDSWESPVS